jgi:hypothetical protein
MVVRFGKPANGIEKDYKYLLTKRRDSTEIALATSNRIGIHATSSTVNVSTSL